MSATSTQVSAEPFPKAIVIAVLSLLVTLIIIPTFLSHLRNRNLPASVLVLCAIYANFQTSINAVIWPHDDVTHWFSGVGLCDVENKFQSVLQSAFPASVAMVLRALARVMDTNSANWSLSTKAKRKDLIIDWTCCVIVPMFQVINGFIVQPFRSYVFGIAGCVAPGDGTWLFFLLMVVPPMLWTLCAVYYAGMLLQSSPRFSVLTEIF
jgi:pheromone a factor receptor